MVITEEVRRAFQDAHSYLLSVFSFVGILIYSLRIIFTKDIETAAVNDKHELFVNPDFFLRLSVKQRIFVLAHEAYHLIFRDIIRAEGQGLEREEEWELWNIVADSVNNHMLVDALRLTATEIDGLKPVLLSNIRKALTDLGVQITEEELEKMCKEEIYNLFKKHGGVRKGLIDGGLLGGDISKGKAKHPVDGGVIIKGNSGIYKDPTGDKGKIINRIYSREYILEVAAEQWRNIFMAHYPEVWAVTKALDRILVYVDPKSDVGRIPSEVSVNIDGVEYKVPVQVVIAPNPRLLY
jgi:hypothetical protein